MTDKAKNMERWNRLSKTDPSATKKFKRTGFSGTAVNPLYLIQRMTEEFGSAGEGWGVKSAEFQTVFPQDVEPLVYCTATIWVGSPDRTVIGVGGDTMVTTFKSGGSIADDEAFKKAYTDALGNAFKQLGMAADIYMGLFDDHKYVQEREREVQAEASPHKEVVDDIMARMKNAETVADLDNIASELADVKDDLKRSAPGLLTSVTNFYRTQKKRIEGAAA